MDAQPTWSADGSRIAFEVREAANGSRPAGIYVTPSDGKGREQFVAPLRNVTLVSWSTDGRFLTYQQSGNGTGVDVWVLPLDGDKKPIPVLNSRADEMGLRISPDGRYISYRSTETGRSEVYVRAFDAANPASAARSQTWKVSVDPGVARAGVRWRSDGKELYYISAGGEVMAVEVTTAPFKAGTPKLLFHVPPAYQSADNSAGASDVSADGKIFALSVP